MSGSGAVPPPGTSLGYLGVWDIYGVGLQLGVTVLLRTSLATGRERRRWHTALAHGVGSRRWLRWVCATASDPGPYRPPPLLLPFTSAPCAEEIFWRWLAVVWRWPGLALALAQVVRATALAHGVGSRRWLCLRPLEGGIGRISALTRLLGGCLRAYRRQTTYRKGRRDMERAYRALCVLWIDIGKEPQWGDEVYSGASTLHPHLGSKDGHPL